MMATVHYIKPIPEDQRLTVLPIARPRFWNLYSQAQKCFWTPDEIKMICDAEDYRNKLDDNERRAISYLLALFATLDTLVNINIVSRFRNDLDIPEINFFYNFQSSMEDIHAIAYAKMLQAVILDRQERDRLINAVHHVPTVSRIADFVRSCTRSIESFGARLMRMICVEGVLFMGPFALIFWLQKRGIMPGFGESNEWIARDEGLHTLFGCAIYDELQPEYKLSRDEIVAIVEEAVGIAADFMRDAVPAPLMGINADSLTQYVKHQADEILALINEDPHYEVDNPFKFMEQINISARANFFERNVTTYSKPTNEVSTDGYQIVEEL